MISGYSDRRGNYCNRLQLLLILYFISSILRYVNTLHYAWFLIDLNSIQLICSDSSLFVNSIQLSCYHYVSGDSTLPVLGSKVSPSIFFNIFVSVISIRWRYKYNIHHINRWSDHNTVVYTCLQL